MKTFPQQVQQIELCIALPPHSIVSPAVITDTTFTVFDVETTGLNPKTGDRIVEIAGVRIEGGKVDEEKSFVTLVNPEREVSWEAKRINNISDEDLQGAPLIADVLPQFLEFAAESLLVAHNATFDMGFLESEKEHCWGYIEIPDCLCTMQLSRKVFPHEYRHNLDIVSSRLGFSLPDARHRALPDVILTANVLLKLIELGHITSLSELKEKAAPQALAWR